MTVSLRPLAEADAERLREIRREPEVWRFWDELEDDFPMGDEPEAERFVIETDGEVVGMIEAHEEDHPSYRMAEFDLFVSAAHHSRGIGSEALRQLVRMMIDERGHRRFQIEPGADNAAAIRCYEKAGFRRAGRFRKSDRIPGTEEYRDSIPMDLLAEEFEG